MKLLILTAFILAWAGFAPGAHAHEVRPAVISMLPQQDGRYALELKVNLEAVVLGIGTVHANTDDAPQAEAYRQLRALDPAALGDHVRANSADLLGRIQLAFDGQPAAPVIERMDIPGIGNLEIARISTVTLGGTIPGGSTNVQWAWAAELGSNVFRYRDSPEGELQAFWLDNGEASPVVALGAAAPTKGTWEVVEQYTWLGLTHIVPKGLDHILFVLGLYLLSLKWRPLLYQVSAFTLAHTITLGLSIYGYINLSPEIVEPLIALSIVYVAVENILSPKLKPWRVALVFGFGLLHGMGFAGVLTELGLPRSEYVTALISFNVGVELGQLLVIATAFLVAGAWFGQRSWYRGGVVIPASVMIAAVGAYWTVERVI